MSDKDRNSKPIMTLFGSVRRSSMLRTEETRPMLPSTPSRNTAAAGTRRTTAFEISIRDKGDATAKRGFRVQVPKRILTYTVLVFVIAPLFLFWYAEVQTRKQHSHSSLEHQDMEPKKEEQHDVLSMLTDQQDSDDTEDAIAAAVNKTLMDGSLGKNSTLGVNENDDLEVQAAELKQVATTTNETKLVVVDKVEFEAETEAMEEETDEADAKDGQRRLLRHPRR